MFICLHLQRPGAFRKHKQVKILDKTWPYIPQSQCLDSLNTKLVFSLIYLQISASTQARTSHLKFLGDMGSEWKCHGALSRHQSGLEGAAGEGHRRKGRARRRTRTGGGSTTFWGSSSVRDLLNVAMDSCVRKLAHVALSSRQEA